MRGEWSTYRRTAVCRTLVYVIHALHLVSMQQRRDRVFVDREIALRIASFTTSYSRWLCRFQQTAIYPDVFHWWLRFHDHEQ
eukprot:4554307-Pyramimonas_sp.AAC.1